ncbi:MAG: alpha/beta hydrolase [Alphaproteobacteria bacterium]|nr:alpha/beta hydrolase [Alphaproteobacteria bacterium]
MIRHGFAEANELKLHYAASGPTDGHMLLFLHGFPEFWYAWRHQLSALSDRYLCVAPDLPGYNLSSKPPEVERYRTKRLIEDVVAFAKQFSRRKKFTLIAHDWGGALAWAFAIKHPDLIDRLVIINAVHPGAFQREIAKNPAQANASQYIHELRAEGAEQRYAANDYALVWRSLSKTADAGHLNANDRAKFIKAWSEPGVLTSMFNWYRAMRMDPPKKDAAAPQVELYNDEALMVRVPTLVIWGMQDTSLLPGCVDGLERWVTNLDVRRVPDASHWIVYEKPQLINETLRDWLNPSS